MKFFGNVKQQILDLKSWYSSFPAPPSYALTFSIPDICETIKGSPEKFLVTVKQQILDGKSWYPSFA